MNSRYWPLALILAALPVFIGTPGASADDAAHRLVGAGSCAASACHNNHYVTGLNKREHAFWVTGDRHGDAYNVLVYGDLAKGIQRKRQSPVPAHEDQRCLSCHVAPQYDVKNPPRRHSHCADDEKNPPPVLTHFKSDGVSCESCHGPASNWIAKHHLNTWKSLSPHAKASHGMNDTQSLVGRAQACVRCHIGEPGMDVDHDLIGAGHPRLNFEYATYHGALAKHWPSSKDNAWPRGGPDLEARTWIVGQLVSAQAALELLRERAANEKKSWPDFAQHDCLACHHDLQAKNQKADFGKRKPGVIPWGNYLTMTPAALDCISVDMESTHVVHVASFKKALTDLHKTMDLAVSPDRASAARHAADASDSLNKILHAIDGKLPERLPLDKTFRGILTAHAARSFSSVDEVTQLQLSLAALGHDLKPFPADLRQPWQDLSKKLVLPSNYERARTFDPQRIRTRITELKDLGR